MVVGLSAASEGPRKWLGAASKGPRKWLGAASKGPRIRGDDKGARCANEMGGAPGEFGAASKGPLIRGDDRKEGGGKGRGLGICGDE